MLSRFIYRVAAVFFLLGAVACWLMSAFCLIALIIEQDPKFFFLGLWSVVLAFLLGGARKDAWRSARYDPLYHDYP